MEQNRVDVSATFDNVDKASAFQMALSLAAIEKIGSHIPVVYREFARDSMYYYRISMKDSIVVSEEAQEMYVQMRMAQTWKDVVDAFDAFSNYLSSVKKPIVRTRELLSIQVHFEELILNVIKRLDNTEALQKEVPSLENAIHMEAALTFASQAIHLVKSGLTPEAGRQIAKNIFDNMSPTHISEEVY